MALSTPAGRLVQRLMVQFPATDQLATALQRALTLPVKPTSQAPAQLEKAPVPTHPAAHDAFSSGGGATVQVLSRQLPAGSDQPFSVHVAVKLPL